jgi:hypothetical protein
MRYRTTALLASAASAALLGGVARADDQAPPAPAATPAPAAAPSPPTLLPSMSGPLAANGSPTSFDLGPLGKKVYITGALSGLALFQDHTAAGDHNEWGDISNAQVFINKPDGLIQYFIEAGSYSIPDLGTPYLKSSATPAATYGVLSQAYLKIAPTSNFSVEAGKLPTLVGAEYTFSIENMNIERGLLWNQEPAVSRGVQVNYTMGPLALAASWNDGLYSNHYSWVSGSATWTINKTSTLALIGAGNTETTNIATTATPLYQNNEQIYNLIYTYTNGPWIIEPYIQYSRVPAATAIGALQSASTIGGALFVNYTFDSKSKLAGFSLPVRVEYISSNGSLANGAPSLLYGPGSNAWSVTVTPTYQYKIYFIRAEVSYVSASSTTPGYGFGPDGLAGSQTRGLIETGVLF